MPGVVDIDPSDGGFVTPPRACGILSSPVAKRMKKISYRGYRFPPEIIHQAIWLYLRFTLSLRDVEDLLAERGMALASRVPSAYPLREEKNSLSSPAFAFLHVPPEGPASAQTHSKDSGTTIPWARPPSEPARFHRGLHKGRRNLCCTFCLSQCTRMRRGTPSRLLCAREGGLRFSQSSVSRDRIGRRLLDADRTASLQLASEPLTSGQGPAPPPRGEERKPAKSNQHHGPGRWFGNG